MAQILHFVLILLGVFFLYTAMFIYQDGDNKIQNKLADIYLEIQIFKDKYSTVRALMLKANEMLTAFFERYFDGGRLTLNFIGMAGLLYACFFGCLLLLLDNAKNDESPFLGIFNRPQYLFYCAFLIAIVFLAYKKLNSRFPIYFMLVILGLLIITVDSIVDSGMYPRKGIILEFYIPFVLSIICLKANIILTRWSFKILIDKKRSLLIIPLLAISMVVICGLMFGAVLLLNSFDDIFLGGIAIFFSFLPVALLIVITNTAFILLFLAIVANKIVFPILAEPIRALYEHNLIKNKKILAAIGFLFLFIAFPSFMDNPVMKAVKGLFK
jgi:hypothetical protein